MTIKEIHLYDCVAHTFIYTVNVLLLCDDAGQTLHQQESFTVALDRCRALVEHLV